MTSSPRSPRTRRPARSASTTATEPHPPEVLAGQAPHAQRDGVYFESAFASAAKKPIDGVALQAALAALGWSALALDGDPKRPSRKPQTLEATWLVSARHSQAALEAAVATAVAQLSASDELDDWLQDFTQSGQGASFELEHFKGWSALQWFRHEFGDGGDGDDNGDDSDDDADEDDDDDGDGDDDGPAATVHADAAATKPFATFPAALQATLARSRQVYALRSEQASDDSAAWQPALAEACEAMARALGASTASVELFERDRRDWAYRIW
ncbi:hypothetical protein [Ideonella sp.]|uniref:hypothetical protein n=1 Tax=Ideonella sp. TaxID=1929293 RepID=UPI0035B2DCF5